MVYSIVDRNLFNTYKVYLINIHISAVHQLAAFIWSSTGLLDHSCKELSHLPHLPQQETEIEAGLHVLAYLHAIGNQCFPQDKRKRGGGDLAGPQSMKLYLGAWCMYILHS